MVTNLDSTLKSRDVTLLTNIHLIKVMVFPVVMYGCESWTIKKKKLSAEELMPSNHGAGEDSCESLGLQGDQTSQSYRINPDSEYSLEGLLLKVKLQYFGHLMGSDSLEKTLMLGNIEGRTTRCLDVITDSMDLSLSKLREMVKDNE